MISTQFAPLPTGKRPTSLSRPFPWSILSTARQSDSRRRRPDRCRSNDLMPRRCFSVGKFVVLVRELGRTGATMNSEILFKVSSVEWRNLPFRRQPEDRRPRPSASMSALAASAAGEPREDLRLAGNDRGICTAPMPRSPPR